MDIIVVGAGAVGIVVGTLLERAGHTVSYLDDPRRHPGRARSRGFEAERDGRPPLRSGSPRWLPDGSPPPQSDCVLVCVRSEQLAAALAHVAQHLGAERAVAIATYTFEGARNEARKAGLSGPALAFHVSFGAALAANDASGSDRTQRVWWYPFTPPSLISAEGEPRHLELARRLARALATAGVPARAVPRVPSAMQLLAHSVLALLPGWELCDWDIARLARDAELRGATADAMHELARTLGPKSGLGRVLARGLPRAFYPLALRVLPVLMGARDREVWRIHGPKIHEQTRFVLEGLLQRARRDGHALPNLSHVHKRWLRALDAVS